MIVLCDQSVYCYFTIQIQLYFFEPLKATAVDQTASQKIRQNEKQELTRLHMIFFFQMLVCVLFFSTKRWQVADQLLAAAYLAQVGHG